MKKSDDITRKCIVTGEVKDKSHLLRFIVTPDKILVPDLHKKLPGKGVYVSSSYRHLKYAIEKNLFAKALKQNVKVTNELLPMVENILHKNALKAISLARKSGDAVIGFDNVLEFIMLNKVDFVLEASDAGNDGHKKLQHKAEDLLIYRLFSVEELDKALDKVNTVYLAFLKGRMAGMVKHNFEKLSDFLKDKNI